MFGDCMIRCVILATKQKINLYEPQAAFILMPQMWFGVQRNISSQHQVPTPLLVEAWLTQVVTHLSLLIFLDGRPEHTTLRLFLTPMSMFPRAAYAFV